MNLFHWQTRQSIFTTLHPFHDSQKKKKKYFWFNEAQESFALRTVEEMKRNLRKHQKNEYRDTVVAVGYLVKFKFSNFPSVIATFIDHRWF